jgi:hypothetical protein
MNKAGTEQQALDQQALNAQYNEYLRQLKYPTDMLTLDRNILAGLPIETSNIYGAKPSLAQQVAGGISGVSGIVDSLMGKGFTQAQTAKYLKDAFGDKLTPAQIQAEIQRNKIEQDQAVAQDMENGASQNPDVVPSDDTGFDPTYGYGQD